MSSSTPTRSELDNHHPAKSGSTACEQDHRRSPRKQAAPRKQMVAPAHQPTSTSNVTNNINSTSMPAAAGHLNAKQVQQQPSSSMKHIRPPPAFCGSGPTRSPQAPITPKSMAGLGVDKSLNPKSAGSSSMASPSANPVADLNLIANSKRSVLSPKAKTTPMVVARHSAADLQKIAAKTAGAGMQASTPTATAVAHAKKPLTVPLLSVPKGLMPKRTITNGAATVASNSPTTTNRVSGGGGHSRRIVHSTSLPMSAGSARPKQSTANPNSTVAFRRTSDGRTQLVVRNKSEAAALGAALKSAALQAITGTAGGRSGNTNATRVAHPMSKSLSATELQRLRHIQNVRQQNLTVLNGGTNQHPGSSDHQTSKKKPHIVPWQVAAQRQSTNANSKGVGGVVDLVSPIKKNMYPTASTNEQKTTTAVTTGQALLENNTAPEFGSVTTDRPKRKRRLPKKIESYEEDNRIADSTLARLLHNAHSDSQSQQSSLSRTGDNERRHSQSTPSPTEQQRLLFTNAYEGFLSRHFSTKFEKSQKDFDQMLMQTQCYEGNDASFNQVPVLVSNSQQQQQRQHFQQQQQHQHQQRSRRKRQRTTANDTTQQPNVEQTEETKVSEPPKAASLLSNLSTFLPGCQIESDQREQYHLQQRPSPCWRQVASNFVLQKSINNNKTSGSSHGSEPDLPELGQLRGWSAANVARFLLQFPWINKQHVERIEIEQVDGEALMLCSMEDFQRLGLKLGPAIKTENLLRAIKHEKSTSSS